MTLCFCLIQCAEVYFSLLYSAHCLVPHLLRDYNTRWKVLSSEYFRHPDPELPHALSVFCLIFVL